jgi:polyisoprenoid-binding protein YceI
MSDTARVTGKFTIEVPGIARPYTIEVGVDTYLSQAMVKHSECKGAGQINLTRRELDMITAINSMARNLRSMAEEDSYYD